MGKVYFPKIAKGLGRLSLAIKRNAPEIALFAGSASALGGFIWGCISSTKLEAVIDNTKEHIEDIKANPEEHEEIEKDIRAARVEGAKEIAKLYLPPVALVSAGFAGIYASHHAMAKNKALLAAAYASLQSGFSAYRKRVIDKYGEEAEEVIRLNARDREIVVPDNNNHPVTKIVREVDGNDDPVVGGIYDRFFDESSPFFRYIVRKTVVGTEYVADTENNFIFLVGVLSELQRKLDIRGWLLLNEAYEKLGIKQSYAGQFAGWLRGDKIDFGIFNPDSMMTRRFVNQLEEVVLLRFNVRDNIIDKVFPNKT